MSAASTSTIDTVHFTGFDCLRSMSASEMSDSGIVASGCFETMFWAITPALLGVVGVAAGSDRSLAISCCSESGMRALPVRAAAYSAI